MAYFKNSLNEENLDTHPGQTYPYKIAAFWSLISAGLYIFSLYNYLLFHSLVEIFSIVVAAGIFIIAWNSTGFAENKYLTFIGIAYLSVASLDLFHTLAYKGMGVFKEHDANLPTQLWIAARYVESISLFTAVFISRKKVNPRLTFAIYSFITALLLTSIFYWEVFPDCFIEGKGLTAFKVTSEYIISLTLFCSVFLLLKYRHSFDPMSLKLVIASILLTIASEISFTLYVSAYGFSNFAGHLFKVISFYLIYKALIQSGLTRPYDILFRNLKSSEARFRAVADTAYEGIISADSSGNIVYWNSGAESIFGYTSEEITGRSLTTIMPERFHNQHNAGISRYIESSSSDKDRKNIVLEGMKKDGSEFPIELSVASWETREGIFFTAIIRDIEERQIVENELMKHRINLVELVAERTSELERTNTDLEQEIKDRLQAEKEIKLMALFAELSPSPVLRFNPQGKILMANPAASDIFNSHALTDTYLGSLIPGLEDFDFSKCISEGAINSHTTKVGNRIFHFIFRGIIEREIGHIYGSDITDQKKAEEESMRKSHLAALGELAAGVAHEINNPINGIINYSQLILNRATQDSRENQIAHRIIKEGDRIAGIVKSLLSFARDDKSRKYPSDIKDIMSDSLALTEAQLRKSGIRIIVDIENGLPPIIANPQQIEQVMLNFISNARSALNSKNHGAGTDKTIRITAGRENIDNKPCVYMTFYDNGSGIKESLIDKITDPFFTTKPAGLGTGLGLSISHGIISDHDGKMTIESVEGEYTSVTVRLPACK